MTKVRPSLICATGNAEKFALGKQAFGLYGIELVQQNLAIDEIQGEDSLLILHDKAKKAYELLGKPVLVSDDSWGIPALKGFPGAYMKSVNYWFDAQDFIDLMAEKADKTIFLYQRLAYIDDLGIQIFEKEIKGTFLDEARGVTGPPIMHVVTLEGDDGLSIAELFDKGLAHKRALNRDAWKDAAIWYAEKIGLSDNES